MRNFSIRRVNAKAACNGTIVTPIATGYTPSPPFHNLLLSILKVSFFSRLLFVDIVGSKALRTLKSLINEQGGYVVFLVLREYSFIRDFRVL